MAEPCSSVAAAASFCTGWVLLRGNRLCQPLHYLSCDRCCLIVWKMVGARQRDHLQRPRAFNRAMLLNGGAQLCHGCEVVSLRVCVKGQMNSGGTPVNDGQQQQQRLGHCQGMHGHTNDLQLPTLPLRHAPCP